MSSPKIAVIGAGPSGLTLARILHKNGLDVTVLEMDSSRAARAQGGSLDLRKQGGQAALEAAGLLDEWKKQCRLQGQDFTIVDKDNVVHLNERSEGLDYNNPEIDRQKLRDILVDSIPADMIKWGSKVRSVERGAVHLEDRTEKFDLIIGADGAWSKVRAAIHPHIPFYSSISSYEVYLRDLDRKHPKVGEMVGQGSFFALGGETGFAMMCQRQDDGSVKIYLAKQTPETWVKDGHIDASKPDEARANLIEELQACGWAPELLELVRLCDDDITPRPAYMLPPGVRWRNVPGLTLMGDAAHLMTPFLGEGCNVAMWDAKTLAEAILEQPDDLTAAVMSYETKMFAMAKTMTEATWTRLLDRFDTGAAVNLSVDIQRRRNEAREKLKRDAAHA